VLSLKLKTLYSFKQFVQLRKVERAKTEKLSVGALARRKNCYFQSMVDCYAISKIEVML